MCISRMSGRGLLPWLMLAVVGALALAVPALATQPGVGGTCINEQLRIEQPYGLRLPDCRAYELVSPLEKDDNGVIAGLSRAAASGNAITYISQGAFADPKSALAEGRYISRRGAGGWSTQNISPPYTDYRTNGSHPPFDELFFTADLSKGVLEELYSPLLAGEPIGYNNLYLAETATASYEPITSFSALEKEQQYEPWEELSDSEPQMAGVSSDLTHVVFQQARSVSDAPDAPKRVHIYEWDGGSPVLVDVPSPGVVFEGDSNVGAYALANSFVEGGDTWHAVSSNASRVFFTAQEKLTEEGVGQVYVRKNPTAPQSPYGAEGKCTVTGDACTVEVSASQKSNGGGPEGSDPHGPRPAFYRDASADGSRVFFTSRAELTNDAYTGPEDNAANLYEYDMETGVLTDLTVDTTDADGAEVLGVVNAAEDGSYIYFVANGALAERAHPGNCKLSEGEASVAGERSCNLYVEHYDGTGWEAPKFIAALSGSNAKFSLSALATDGDERDWVGYEETNVEDRGPGSHTARVSPDGRLLAFESELSLTGFDNVPVESGVCGEHDRCREVYIYDAGSGSHPPTLVCASCDATARPVGPAELGGTEQTAGQLNSPLSFYLPDNLVEVEGGGRLLFQTPDGLASSDSNGLLDVYEWESPGVGSCAVGSPGFDEGAGGCVFPISSAAGGEESRFMDASASGDDVFIATSHHLLPEANGDTRINVYDARVGGGFPLVSPAPGCDNADSCKPPVSPQPGVFGVPASETFSGPGSSAHTPPPPVSPPKKTTTKTVKCKKKQKLSHGKCVRKKKPKKAKKSAHTNRRARS